MRLISRDNHVAGLTPGGASKALELAKSCSAWRTSSRKNRLKAGFHKNKTEFSAGITKLPLDIEGSFSILKGACVLLGDGRIMR